MDDGMIEQGEQVSGAGMPTREELVKMVHADSMEGFSKAWGVFEGGRSDQDLVEARKERDGLLEKMVVSREGDREVTLLDVCGRVAKAEEDNFERLLNTQVDQFSKEVSLGKGEGPKVALMHLARIKVFEARVKEKPEEAEEMEGRVKVEMREWREYVESHETGEERKKRERGAEQRELAKKHAAEVVAGEREVRGGSGSEDEPEEMPPEVQQQRFEEMVKQTEEMIRNLVKVAEKSGLSAEKVGRLGREVETLGGKAGQTTGEINGLIGSLDRLRVKIAGPEGVKMSVDDLTTSMENYRLEAGSLADTMGVMQQKVKDIDEAMELGAAKQQDYIDAMERSRTVMDEYIKMLDEWGKTALVAGKRGYEEFAKTHEEGANGTWNQSLYLELEGTDKEMYKIDFRYRYDQLLAEMEALDRPFSQANWQETQQMMTLVFSIKDDEFRQELLKVYDIRRKANDYAWVMNRAASIGDCVSAAGIIDADSMAELMRMKHYREKIGEDGKVVGREIVKDGKVVHKMKVYEELDKLGKSVIDTMVDEYQEMTDVHVMLEDLKRAQGERFLDWAKLQTGRGRSFEEWKASDWAGAWLEEMRRTQGMLREVMVAKRDGKKVADWKGTEGAVGQGEEITRMLKRLGLGISDGDKGVVASGAVFDGEEMRRRLEAMIEKDAKGKAVEDKEYGYIHRLAMKPFAFYGLTVSSGVRGYDGEFFLNRLVNMDDMIRDDARNRFPGREALVEHWKLTPGARTWLSEFGMNNGYQFEKFCEDFGVTEGEAAILTAGAGTNRWGDLDRVRIDKKFAEAEFKAYGVDERRYATYFGDPIKEMDAFRVFIRGGGSESLLALPTKEKMMAIWEKDVKWFMGWQEQRDRVPFLADMARGMLEFYRYRGIFEGMPIFSIRGGDIDTSRSFSEKSLGKKHKAWNVSEIDDVIHEVEPYLTKELANSLRRDFEKFAGLPGVTGIRHLRMIWDELEPEKAVPMALIGRDWVSRGYINQ
jgi:hypothetical protein